MPRHALTKLKRPPARVTRKDLWQLFQAVVTAVSHATTVRDALQVVLDLVCEYTGWPVGHVYLLDDTDASKVPSSRIWSLAVPDRFDAFRSATEAGPASLHVGLAGLVVSSGTPAWTVRVASDLDLPRARAAAGCGLRSAMAFPIRVRAEVAGVLEFFSPAAVKPDDHLLGVMGSIVAVLGGALERDRTGKDLWQSEHFATTVLASVGEGVIVYDRQLRYRIWNRFMEELTGMAPEQVLGRRAFDVFPHLVEQGVDKILERALAGETVTSPDTPYRVPATGKTGWVVGTYGPHLSPEGRIVGVVGVVRDITARKRVEERLQQSEERFRTLIEHSPNTIALLGADGSVVEAPAARPSANGIPGNPLGRHILESLHPDDHETVTKLLDELVARPGASAPLLVRVRHADGSWRWLEGSATNLLAEPLVKAVFLNYRDVTERKRASDELRERAVLMHQFMRLSETLDETLAEDEVVRAVAQGAQILSRTDRVSVYLWRPDGTATCAWSHGTSDAHIAFVLAHHSELPGTRVARGETDATEIAWNEAVPGIKALIVSDTGAVPPQTLIYRLAQANGHRAVAAWPLPHKRRVTGMLVCHFDRERPWSRAEQEVFQTFCWEAGTALENAQLYARQAERTEELEAFFKLSKQLRTSSTVEEMYPIIVERAKELLRAASGTLSLLDPTRQTFTRVYCAGLAGEVKGSTFPMAGSRSGRVIQSGTPYVTEDFASEPFSGRDPAPYLALGPVAIVPVRSEQETIGTLAVGRLKPDRPRPYSEAEVRLLEGVAEIGGTAIQRARLHHNLEDAYLQIVVALAGAVDARDTYTSDHSERMAHWAETVARALGCGEHEVQDIRRAARLHDIGKIGIPDSILLKPMALSEAEWGVMRRHPLIGADILMCVQRMRGVAQLVRHHQERWDGTGYPESLKGEETPLGARILAVVDAYSAIIDERPYKHARTHAEAMAEIRRCAGTQFDPRVVDAFCQVVEEDRAGLGAPREGQG